jgi:hypothetical protein
VNINPSKNKKDLQKINSRLWSFFIFIIEAGLKSLWLMSWHTFEVVRKVRGICQEFVRNLTTDNKGNCPSWGPVDEELPKFTPFNVKDVLLIDK